jgi:hypothetical protein
VGEKGWIVSCGGRVEGLGLVEKVESGGGASGVGDCVVVGCAGSVSSSSSASASVDCDCWSGVGSDVVGADGGDALWVGRVSQESSDD